MNDEIKLKYGCNPHQVPARIYIKDRDLPLEIINGKPGYINLLDALNSWQLVKELKQALNQPAAASFKHVSPAGAAVGVPLNETMKRVYFIGNLELSPLATAYARARGADRISSFCDWVALSDEVDVATARLLRREISDGIIAPGFDSEALLLLQKKKKGKYIIIKIDPKYEPSAQERREVFGITFEQRRNNELITTKMLDNIVTDYKTLPDTAKRDLAVALISLKYTQSNSVCLACDGQVIGAGAGQQSRIHCTRLAADKADLWFLRQNPRVLGLKFREGLRRQEKDNAIDLFLRDDLTSAEEKVWEKSFEEVPKRFTIKEKREWLSNMKEISLGSDAFFPFRDNIDRAHQSGVKYIAQPGGSIRDDAVVQACNEYGMAMVFSGIRLFHH